MATHGQCSASTGWIVGETKDEFCIRRRRALGLFCVLFFSLWMSCRFLIPPSSCDAIASVVIPLSSKPSFFFSSFSAFSLTVFVELEATTTTATTTLGFFDGGETGFFNHYLYCGFFTFFLMRLRLRLRLVVWSCEGRRLMDGWMDGCIYSSLLSVRKLIFSFFLSLEVDIAQVVGSLLSDFGRAS